MAVASVAISVPKPFSSGDAADEWFLRFDICSAANDWTVKAVKLPTLLAGEGEALAAWLDLGEDDRKEYKPPAGESLSLFSHELKKLLEHTMPEIDQKTRDQLLLHHFVAGQPMQLMQVSKQNSELFKPLMSLYEQQPVAAITPTDPKRNHKREV